jgi:hypothetical protein
MLGRVIAAVVAAAALGGCSLGGDEEPKPAGGAVSQVARAIGALERATRARDWAAICDELFSAAARRRAGGRDCALLLGETAGGVTKPSIRVLAIEFDGDRARTRVRTRSRGQSPVEDTIVLVREGGEWRVESLVAG